MFVDACAIVAVLSDEPEAARVSDALSRASAFTSPVALLEAVLALARPDKFDATVEAIAPIVQEFLDERGIELRDLPPAQDTARLALHAAHRYRSGRRGLNLGDCLHYASARFHQAPILATADEFRETDLQVIA
jgi:ribonuclease VapC